LCGTDGLRTVLTFTMALSASPGIAVIFSVIPHIREEKWTVLRDETARPFERGEREWLKELAKKCQLRYKRYTNMEERNWKFPGDFYEGSIFYAREYRREGS